MDDARTTPDGSMLPKYVRFARSLALVSGATIGLGIAVGSTVFTTEGCMSCTGVCGDYYKEPDASADHSANPDAEDAGEDGAPDAGIGGGPLPAPPLPEAWLA
ncbi:MAG TPA: hypothetical protein VN903_13850 [Polyangia bacterium]|nr:hypothetical protein [Polyangia bacterium]